MKTNPIGSFLLLLAILAISLFILHMPMVIEAMIILSVLIALHRMIVYSIYHRRNIRHEIPAKLIGPEAKQELRKQRA